MVDIKQLATVRLGEGPHWDPTNRCLLFVDIVNGDLHRYYPATKEHQKLHLENVNTGNMVGFVLPVEGQPDLLVVGLGRSLVVVEWPLDSKETIAKPRCVLHSVEGHEPNNRFNDGKCDPSGRIWAGTMAQESGPAVLEREKGALYCLNTDLSLATTVSKITLSNGLAWSGDKKTFYYIDSMAYSVDAFDYDDVKGKISNRRVLLDFKAAGLVPDIPDGICTDQEGNIWVACFSGKKVICVDPASGKVLRKVDMPTPNITSVCWGGDDYSTLFVTSGQLGLSEDQLKADPAAGGLFAVTGLGVKGLPPHNFKVDLKVLTQKMTSA